MPVAPQNIQLIQYYFFVNIIFQKILEKRNAKNQIHNLIPLFFLKSCLFENKMC